MTRGEERVRSHAPERPAGPDPLRARILCPDRMTTGRFVLFSMALAAAVSVASGCGPALVENLNQAAPRRLSEEIPPFKLDSSASMVIYEGNDSPTEADAASVRVAFANLLDTRYGRGGVTPARFRLRVSVNYRWWPAIACIDLQIVGCPTGYADARVILDLQVGDKLFVGHGQGTGYGGLYYNKLTGVHSALGEALGNAAANLFPTTWPASGT
jgi:hypothetical protein